MHTSTFLVLPDKLQEVFAARIIDAMDSTEPEVVIECNRRGIIVWDRDRSCPVWRDGERSGRQEEQDDVPFYADVGAGYGSPIPVLVCEHFAGGDSACGGQGAC